MAVPPKGDVRRPLHLAIRSAWVMGILLIALSMCGIVGAFMVRRTAGPGLVSLAWFQIAGTLVYLVPGVGYVVCAIYMRQRKLWAVIVTLVLASLQLLLALLGLVGLLIGWASDGGGEPMMLTLLFVVAIIVLALSQMVYHLARSFEAIKLGPPEEPRGFEPLSVQPVVPLPTPPADQANVNDRPK